MRQRHAGNSQLQALSVADGLQRAASEPCGDQPDGSPGESDAASNPEPQAVAGELLTSALWRTGLSWRGARSLRRVQGTHPWASDTAGALKRT